MSTAVPPRRAALAFVFVTVVLDMLALGTVIPVLPRLVAGLTADDPARVAAVLGLFGTLWAAMQFLFSPLLGALSDRFGRRPVILISNVGLALDYALMALAPSVGWLLVGRMISGITAASVSAATAYIADVTPPERRAGAYGALGAAFGLGFVLGPALGGLLGGGSPRLPFWVAGSLSLANALYGLVVLPESLPAARRGPFRWASTNPVGALRLLRARAGLLRLSAVAFLGTLAHEALPSIFVLYAGHRYGWRERTVGLTLAAVGLASGAVQALLVRRVVGRLGERRTLLVGLGCGVVGFAAYGAAPSGGWFWLGVPVMALWGLSSPALQGLLTARVEGGEQGQLQGAQSSLMGIAGMLGPALYSALFAAGVGAGAAAAGAPFFVAAALLLAAVPLVWRLRPGPAGA